MKKKTWIIITVAVVVMVAAGIMVWVYKAGRHDESLNCAKVQLEGNYQGNHEIIEQRGIKMAIPLEEEAGEEFIITDDEEPSLTLSGHDYMITVVRQKDKPCIQNSPIEADMKEHYDGCSTMNEYFVKRLLDDKADEVDLMMLSGFGEAYTVVEKEQYVIIVILMSVEKGEGYENITMQIYDTEDDYAYIADVTVWKYCPQYTNILTMEKIAFIVDSLEISSY